MEMKGVEVQACCIQKYILIRILDSKIFMSKKPTIFSDIKNSTNR